jgi:hypothetical protein
MSSQAKAHNTWRVEYTWPWWWVIDQDGRREQRFHSSDEAVKYVTWLTRMENKKGEEF